MFTLPAHSRFEMGFGSSQLQQFVAVSASSEAAEIIIIIVYIYHALINALSAYMIHINLNTVFYTHIEHNPAKSMYIKYYIWKHTHTHARTHAHARTHTHTQTNTL